MELPNVNTKFLEEVKFFSTGNLSETVQSLLTNGGSKSFKYASDMMTHCIVGENADTSAIEEVRDIFEKPVVLSNWVPLSAHASKLLPVLPFDPKIPAIFKGVIASVSQVSAKDVKKLWALLEIHGGKLKTALDFTCTHLICAKASGSKFNEALKHESVVIVTPDWIIQCIMEKSLVGSEGFHPSLLIEPKEKSPPQPSVEAMKHIKLSLEKKEEVKSRIEEPKPIEVKNTEVRNIHDTSILVQQPAQPDVINHPTTPITAPPSTKNMRIASNLPPHLEQQLQQHSMMRNTAPRQQHQGVGAHSGVRMVRSGSGTTWRGASQQQTALQRSVSSGVDQRPQQQATQGVRLGSAVHQIRGQAPQLVQQGINNQSQLGNHQQTAQQQLPGMVRQVRLVNPNTQSLQQPLNPEQLQRSVEINAQQRGQANNPNSFQQPQHRLPVSQSPQIVKMVVSQSQTDGKLPNHPQQPPVSSPLINQQQPQFSNHYSQNGQQMQTLGQQSVSGQVTPQQHHFQQVTEDNANITSNNVNPQLRQQQAVENSFSSAQAQNNAFAQQHQRSNTRMPITSNIQQSGQMPQQTLVRTQMIQRQQHPQQGQGAPQQSDYSSQIMATGVGTVSTGGASQVQGTVNQQMGAMSSNQQQVYNANIRPNIRPTIPAQAVVAANAGRPSPNGAASPMVQQQPQPQPPVQQVRPLTVYQQQMLHMHIQNMSPQARQQLQQLTPQMRYAVLQRILQQQEQQQTIHQAQTQPPNPTPQMQGQPQNQTQQMQAQPPNQTQQMQAQPTGQIISNQGQRMMLAQPQGNWQPDQQQNQLVPPQQQNIHQQNVQQQNVQQQNVQQQNVQQQNVQQQNVQQQNVQQQNVQQQNVQQQNVQQQNVQQQNVQQQNVQQQNVQQQNVQQQNVRPYGPSQGLINQLNQGQGVKSAQVLGVNQQSVDPQVVPSQLQQIQAQQQLQSPLNPVQQPSSLGSLPIQQSNSVPLNQLQLQQQQIQQQQQLQQQQLQQQNQEQPTNSVNPKTKTALANLLSTRLQTAPSTSNQQPGNPQASGHPQQPVVSQQPLIPQQSIVTQQPMILQQAVSSQSNAVPVQPIMNQQQHHILQQQQRRSLQNITNGTGVNTGSALTVVNSPAQTINQQLPKPGMGAVSFTGVRMPGPGSTVIPGQPVIRREFPVQQQQQQLQQQQLHSHEPGVKLPEHLCLLGCIVLIVDYQRSVPSAELLQWTKLISSRGAEIETMYSPRITHLLCETSRSAVAQQALRDGKRLVTAFWLNDVVMKQHMFPPSQVLHFPTPYGDAERPCRNMLVSLSGFEGEDRLRVRFMCEAVGLKYTGHFSRQHDVLICRKPEGPKFQKAREWRKPVVTTNWIAQVYFGFLNAIHQIHHPKYQQFNLPAYQQDPLKFELNMAGNFLAAWRIPVKITPESLDKFNKLPAQLRLKRHSNTLSATGNDDSPSRKKLKIEEEDKDKHERSSSNVDAILEDVIKGGCEDKGKNRVIIRFSGFDSVEVSKAALKLGAGVAHNNREATHLVMPTFMRTPKLLCCLPTVKFILSPRWIHESAQQGKLLEEQPYLLKDTDLERKMDIDLLNLLSMPQRDQLFKGKMFYITPSVVPSRSVLREIVECSGGKVVAQPKSMKAISELIQKDKNGYIVVSCITDLHLLTDVMKSKIGIYSSEFIISAVLKQAIIGAPFRIEL